MQSIDVLHMPGLFGWHWFMMQVVFGPQTTPPHAGWHWFIRQTVFAPQMTPPHVVVH